jgi:hypothetical protein
VVVEQVYLMAEQAAQAEQAAVEMQVTLLQRTQVKQEQPTLVVVVVVVLIVAVLLQQVATAVQALLLLDT